MDKPQAAICPAIARPLIDSIKRGSRPFIGIATLFAFGLGYTPDVSAQTAFSCEPFFFLSQGTDVPANIDLNRINTANPSTTDPNFNPLLEVDTSGINFNALGFNVQNGRFYAFDRDPTIVGSQANYTLYEITTAGITSITTLDLSAQIDDTSDPNRRRLFAGGFNDAGRYFVLSNGGDLIQFDLIGDESGGGATGATIIGDTDIRDNSLASPFIPFIPDIAFNPVDGLFYGVDREDGRLKRFDATQDPPTLTVVPGVPVLSPADTEPFGAVFFDAEGTLYLYKNFVGNSANNGELLRITDVTTSPSLSSLGSARNSTQNDGAACPYTPTIQKTVSPAIVDAGGTVTYEYTIINNTSVQTNNVTFSDILGTDSTGQNFVNDGRVFVAGSLVNPFVGSTVNNFANTNTLQISNITIPARSTSVIRIDVRVPASTPASNPGDPTDRLFNQAELTGQAGGTSVTVLGVSDFPDTPNAFPDPTPLQVRRNPEIGVAKQAGTPRNIGGNLFEVDFTVRVENFGNVSLTNVELNENLQNAFLADPPNTPPATSAQLVTTGPNAPAIATTGNTAGGALQGTVSGINPNFDGGLSVTNDVNLLSAGTNLEPGDFVEVTFTVQVDPGSNLQYANTVTAVGTDPANPGTPVQDTSQDGLAVDPDADQDPTNNNDPTPINFGADLSIIKRITNVTGSSVFPAGFFDAVEDSSDPDVAAVQAAGIAPIGQIDIDPANGEPQLQSGDVVEYTVYFANGGNAAATDVEICDQIPTGTSYVANSTALNDSTNPLANQPDTSVFSNPLTPIDVPPCLPPSNNPNGAVIVGPFNVNAGAAGFLRFRVAVP
ncbi:hypothetical protein [Almyronema epifaneia]|uniref:DUF11 domain-containing protein n=1 Tax=Almyronema epifaneia S1 TaxID=2991925 RepID=A0ABW6ICB3_9CYAN